MAGVSLLISGVIYTKCHNKQPVACDAELIGLHIGKGMIWGASFPGGMSARVSRKCPDRRARLQVFM